MSNKQPLNEAYGNDLLEAYQKISDTFEDFTRLMRMRVPYESWPLHCRIAGVGTDLISVPEDANIPIKLDSPVQQVPIAPCPPPEDNCKDIWDLLREKGFNPLQAFPSVVIARIEDLGRAKEKLKTILDLDIFNRSAFDKFWTHSDSEYNEKLDQLRLEIRLVEENLWDLWAVLRIEEE
jgi:hypothetical protein